MADPITASCSRTESSGPSIRRERSPRHEVADVSGLPSPDGTRVPASSIIVDNDLVVWTLGPGQEILRGGGQARGGYGSQILWYRGEIYVLGDDYNWWRWTGTTWAFYGSSAPV